MSAARADLPTGPGDPPAVRAAAGLRLLGWDDGPQRFLLPADCVLEVIAGREVRPVPAGPPWLVGWADWRQLTLPLVTPRPVAVTDADAGADAGARAGPPRRAGRWLICIGPTDGQGVDLFALRAASHPRLEVLSAAALIEALAEAPADQRVAALGDAGGPDRAGTAPWLRLVTWRGAPALVPDLATLQAALVGLLL